MALPICTGCHFDPLYLAAARVEAKVVAMNLTYISPIFAQMAPEGLFLLRILGVLALLILIPAGVILWRNQDRWFGRCADTPSETSGGLMYGRMQTWLVYLGALHFALWLALG